MSGQHRRGSDSRSEYNYVTNFEFNLSLTDISTEYGDTFICVVLVMMLFCRM